MLGYKKQGLSLDCRFKNMGWLRISFTDVGAGELLLCNQVKKGKM